MKFPKRPKIKPIKHYKREFLNPVSGTAFVESSATYSSVGWVSASLKLADCNNSIQLDFDTQVDSKGRKSKNANFQARIAKIDKIIGSLEKIKELLYVAAEQCNTVDRPAYDAWQKAIGEYEKVNGAGVKTGVYIEEDI